MRLIGLGRCPYCSSDEIYRSVTRTIWDRLAFIVLLRRVRCHRCMRRHFTPLIYPTNRYIVGAKRAPSVGHHTAMGETRKSA